MHCRRTPPTHFFSRSPPFSCSSFMRLGSPLHRPSTSHSLLTSSQQRFSRRPYSSRDSSQHFRGVAEGPGRDLCAPSANVYWKKERKIKKIKTRFPARVRVAWPRPGADNDAASLARRSARGRRSARCAAKARGLQRGGQSGPAGRCGPELGGVRFANHTNITGLSVTDSLVTWYDLRNRPGPPPPGGSVAARGPRPHERALKSQRRGHQRQSGRPQGRISSPVSSVLAWGSGGIRVGIHWGSQGDPDGFRGDPRSGRCKNT